MIERLSCVPVPAPERKQNHSVTPALGSLSCLCIVSYTVHRTIALHLLIKAIPRLASWQRYSGAWKARVFVSLPPLMYHCLIIPSQSNACPRLSSPPHARMRKGDTPHLRLRTCERRQRVYDSAPCQLLWSSFRGDSGLSLISTEGTNQ